MLDYPLSTNSIATPTKWESLVDLLKCQNCGSYQLQIQPSELVCASCRATYPLLGGAAIFRIPVESVEQLSQITLQELSQFWSNPESRQGVLWDSIISLPQSVQERFSAGFELTAIKPNNYLTK
jgi:hypothetical protein